MAKDYPACQLTVLCGHTHEAASYWPASNLEVRVAGAEYGRPDIASVLVVGDQPSYCGLVVGVCTIFLTAMKLAVQVDAC